MQLLCGKQNAQASVRGGRPQQEEETRWQLTVRGEPCLGRGAETNWFTEGSCTIYAKGDEKGLQCRWPNELLDGRYMGTETEGESRET